MTARLLGALEHVPPWARRLLMILAPLVLLGVLIAGFAIAPTQGGDHSDRASAAGRLLPQPPSTINHVRARRGRPAANTGQSPPVAPTGRHPRAHQPPGPAQRRPVHGPASEQPPPSSRRGAQEMLGVARRFAVAYMPYQIGRLHRWARTAIARTCAPGLARDLLAHPAQLTSLQAAHPKDIETYRVVSVEPADAPDTVAVSYVSQQDSADTGEFLLRMVNDHRRWQVARLEA